MVAARILWALVLGAVFAASAYGAGVVVGDPEPNWFIVGVGYACAWFFGRLETKRAG